MLTQTVEYALRAVVYLAKQAPNSPKTGEIAAATHVPQAYLAKVLQGLKRVGLVYSQRGVGGGISLLKKPEELTILEVVNAVDPVRRIRTCPLSLEAHKGCLCSLHKRLDDAMAKVEEAFGATTLAEVLDEPGAGMALCNYPSIPHHDLPSCKKKSNKT